MLAIRRWTAVTRTFGHRAMACAKVRKQAAANPAGESAHASFPEKRLHGPSILTKPRCSG
jgi:hypothetical protein